MYIKFVDFVLCRNCWIYHKVLWFETCWFHGTKN